MMRSFQPATRQFEIYWDFAMRRLLSALLIAGLSVTAAPPATAQQSSYSAPHSARIVGRKLCFDNHTHVGGAPGRTKRIAHKKAIREWIEFTAWEYGTAWASYRRSVKKTVTYIKQEVGWMARVESLPCRTIKRKRRRSKSRRRS